MSVFGNIPAFSGFGKPSIKLEFDDNEALLEFQKKMQAAGDDSAELPEVDFDELKGTEEGIIADIDEKIFDKENLGAAGDVYLVTDTREKPRKDLDEIKAFKKFFIDKPMGVKFINQVGDFDFKTPLTSDGTYSFIELKDRYDERWQDLFREYLHTKYGNLVGRKEIKPLLQKDEYYQQLLTEYKKDKEFINSLSGNDLGKTANNAIYNNVGILDWRGFVPTYRILDDYSDFFKIADSKSTFAGFGLDDTKKLITETCRQHWRDCMAIAKHLKGDSLLQSCFNLWHWLHYNIRYEYDRDGREEIRTPLRVWQDRARGVDCDCLSVFAWCVLKCQGYNPAFELVAFKGRPQFSHIFVNCDGVVVDRVWFIFNNRPPLITKSEIYRVNLTNDLAGLF